MHLVLVVKRGARDRGARHGHRIELRHRREHARAAHLDADLAEHRLLLLGRELEGDGPARRAGGKAELGLLGKAIDLHHHAVDVVIEVPAVRKRVGAEGMHLGRRGAGGDVRVHREASGAEPVQELALGVHVEGGRVRDGVDEGGKVAPGGDLGVLLAQASRGGVARIGEGRLALGIGLGIQPCEAALGHVDLATDLDGRGAVLGHVDERGLR